MLFEKQKAVFHNKLFNGERCPDNVVDFYLNSGATDQMVTAKYLKYMSNIELFDEPLSVECSKRGMPFMSQVW